MADTQHCLKSSWTLLYQPFISRDKRDIDYAAAQRATLKNVGNILTVEQLWSTINLLPKLSSLPNGDCVILSRENKQPSFESFPHGRRLTFDSHSDETSNTVLGLVLSAVLGESLLYEAVRGSSSHKAASITTNNGEASTGAPAAAATSSSVSPRNTSCNAAESIAANMMNGKSEGTAADSTRQATCVTENPCHIVRIAHKPNVNSQSLVRFEIWTDQSSENEKIKDFFVLMLKPLNIRVTEGELK